MKYLRLLLMAVMFVAVPGIVCAQAKFITYQSTIKSMSVTSNGVEAHCMFWSQSSVAAPYTFEAACYLAGKFQWIMATIPGTTITQAFNFPGGSIVWMLSPGDGVNWNYSISGQELLLTPVLVVGIM